MSQQTPTERYLALFSKGKNWREGALFKEQPEAGRHGEYMASLRSSGMPPTNSRRFPLRWTAPRTRG